MALFLAAFSCSPAPSENQKASPTTEASPLASGDVQAKPDWQKQWDRTITEARKEGVVVIYSSTGAAAARDSIIKAVADKYGLKVDMMTGRGAEISQKLLSERKAGIYLADVYIGGATTIVTIFVPAGIFQPLESAFILPEVKDPAYWFGGKHPFFEKTRSAMRLTSQIGTPIAINLSMVDPAEMQSYRDLLNPKLKGKIIMNDPTTSGNGNLFFYMVGVKMMGLDFMRELAKQEPVITRDQRQQAEWLAYGKYAVLVGGLPDNVRQFQQAGAPVVELVDMKEGGYLTSGAGQIALLNNSPHPNAARLFLNWILSREGATVWSKTQGDPSTRVDIPAEGLDLTKVPNPSKKYLQEDEDAIKEKASMFSVAAEIFRASLK